MKPRQLVGAGLLVLVIVAVVLFTVVRGGNPVADAPTADLVVKGYLGGEKTNFIADPEVVALLRQKYHLRVDGTKAGSIELVRDLPLGDDVDFLWPADQVALALYKERGGAFLRTDNVFNSPIVLYSWTPVVEALTANGIVQQDGTTYAIDLPRFVDLIVEGRSWADVGLPQLHGRVAVHTTDPAFSNSGFLFAGLLANTLNGGDVVNRTTVGPILPTLPAVYGRLGFMEQSSGDLFQQFLTTGMGAKPIVAGYEAQLAEFSLQNEAYRQQIRDQVRVLYPRPTVWSAHPLIARTEAGVRLLEALKDPEIQKLAWERHGFRSGVAGVANDPSVLDVTGIPPVVTSSIDMPAPDVMDRILAAIAQAPEATAAATPVARPSPPSTTVPPPAALRLVPPLGARP